MSHLQRIMVVLLLSLFALGLSASLVHSQTQREHETRSQVNAGQHQVEPQSTESEVGFIETLEESVAKVKTHIAHSLLLGLLELKHGLNTLLDYGVFVLIQSLEGI